MNDIINDNCSNLQTKYYELISNTTESQLYDQQGVKLPNNCYVFRYFFEKITFFLLMAELVYQWYHIGVIVEQLRFSLDSGENIEKGSLFVYKIPKLLLTQVIWDSQRPENIFYEPKHITLKNKQQIKCYSMPYEVLFLGILYKKSQFYGPIPKNQRNMDYRHSKECIPNYHFLLLSWTLWLWISSYSRETLSWLVFNASNFHKVLWY